ncbi:MAG: DUF2505 family protein [Acidimicrobiia bacterium]
MKFEITQDLTASVTDVDDALIDPTFLVRMAELPKLGSAEVLDQRRDGDVMHQDVRFLFQAELSRTVTRVVDPALMTWIERSVCDLTRHETTCEILPDHYAGLLTGRYRSTIVERGSGSLRTISGELKVRMPLVGGKVEGAIIGGLKENAAAQVGLLDAFITGR